MAVAGQKESVGATTRIVRSKSTGTVRCAVSANGHTIVTDEPEARGGTNTGAPPLLHLTAALATCRTVQIVKVAKAMRFAHGAINIEASTTTDRVTGLDGNDEVMRFCAADPQIDIETDEPPERLERFKALSEDACPVGMLFTDAGYPPTITWNVLPLKK